MPACATAEKSGGDKGQQGKDSEDDQFRQLQEEIRQRQRYGSCYSQDGGRNGTT